MASDTAKNDGDSARNKESVRSKNSNHIFNEAGENIQYYSDSESTASRKSKTRYINPAIFIEPVEATQSATSLHCVPSSTDITPHPHSSYRSNSTPYLSDRASTCSSSSVKRKSCRLLNTEIDLDEETPRFDKTYRGVEVNGQDTFRLSVASVSSTSTAKLEREQNERKKQEVFKQWCARKDQERREKARLEKLKLQVAKTTTQEQREESFRRWMERKRKEDERKKAEEIMKRYKENERIERERQKREREKEDKLNEWIKKKEEEMKAMKTREERRAARVAIEEHRRREIGERAYREWLRTSKNKPLPVPLNQGELSMRGSVSEMYINPVPWQFPT